MLHANKSRQSIRLNSFSFLGLSYGIAWWMNCANFEGNLSKTKIHQFLFVELGYKDDYVEVSTLISKTDKSIKL